MINTNYGRGLHNQVKRKAEQPGGVSLMKLKPNERDIAQRLVKQGALHSVGGKLVWQESQRITNAAVRLNGVLEK